MRNYEKSSVIGAQEILKPLYACNVEMVGRFVKEQKICAAEQHFGKLQLRLLTAAEHADRLGHLRIVKAEP